MLSGLGDLTAALQKRKKYVDEHSEVAEGTGASLGEVRLTGSKFAGMLFVDKSSTGYTGLVNQGATCYLNSLLQALFMVPEFRRALFLWEYSPEVHGDEESCVPLQMQRLFAQLQLTEKGAITTASLTKSFGWTGSEAFAQQDVQECMSVISEHLMTQCVGTPLAEYLGSADTTGQLGDYLKCMNCQGSRERTEAFKELTLGIRGFDNIEAALRGFLETESIDGVQCGNCDGRYTHLKGLKLKSLPHILTIQLKRFDMDWNTFQRVKINDPLHFPPELDFSSYVEDPSSDLTYELTSVFMHMGSALAGHYFAYLKELTSGKWLLFNDASVTEIEGGLYKTPNTIATPTEPQKSHAVSMERGAYMLFYRRRTLPVITVTPEDMPPSLKEWVEEDNTKYLALKAEWKYERSFLHMKVLHTGRAYMIKIHETKTVADLIQMAFEAVRAQLLQEDDSITVDRVRLCVFDSIRGVLLGPPAEESAKLSSLSEDILRKPLQLETRGDNEQFQDYLAGGFPLRICVFLGGTGTPSHLKSGAVDTAVNNDTKIKRENMFTNVTDVVIGVEATVAELLVLCTQKMSLEADSMLKVIHLQGETAEVLEPSVVISKTNVKAGDQLYLEICSSTDECLLIDYFNNVFNSITVQFNTTIEDDEQLLDDAITVSAAANPSQAEIPRSELRIDQRVSMGQLKEHICSILHLEADQIKLRRAKFGAEFKDLSASIVSQNVEDGSCVWVSRGQALTPNEYSIKILLELLQSEPEISETTSMKKLGRLVTTPHMTTDDLKREVEVKFGDKIRLTLGREDYGWLRLRKCEATPSGDLKLKNVLCNATELEQALGKLRDDVCVCVQTNVNEDEFTPNDMLIRVQRWYPQTVQLSDSRELCVSKNMTYLGLCTFITDILQTLRPRTQPHTPDEGTVANVQEGWETLRALAGDTYTHVRLVKPFAWQLKDVTSIPHLKWGTYCSESAITAQPFRLKDGDTVLCKDDREAELILPASGKSGLPEAPIQETGFKIFTPLQQMQRKETQAKEAEQAKMSLEQVIAERSLEGASAAKLAAMRPLPP